MKRLKKLSSFPTFYEYTNLSLNDIQLKIQEKDNRLKPNLSKPYGNDSNYAGIFIDDSNECFYAVEYLAYLNVPDKKDGKTIYKNYLGIVATRIHYEIANNNVQYSLKPSDENDKPWQYAEVLPFDESTSINDMVSKFKKKIVVNNLSLTYSASNFIDALSQVI